MDGVHDIGGMHGFGPVPIEVDEPLFHEAWEGRVWAMWSAIGATTVDRFRFTIEQMPPAAYLASSYYERWLWAIERLASEQGLLTGSGRPSGRARPSPALVAWDGRFRSGDSVRVRNAVTRVIPGYPGTCAARSGGWRGWPAYGQIQVIPRKAAPMVIQSWFTPSPSTEVTCSDPAPTTR